MKVFTQINDLKNELNERKVSNLSIGFVPTMGFLHEGHLSLIDTARDEHDLVVLSIFVNPLQFGPNEDFERYPRDEERDLSLAEKHHVDYVFIPTIDVMYPEESKAVVQITKGMDVLCGKFRPGHFEGVATVVSKLLHIVEPTTAYFGLKDAQQFAVIRTLVTQLNFPTSLVGLTTIREADGLAKSSRNVYLSQTERDEALKLSEILQKGKALLKDEGQDLAQLEEKLKTMLRESLKHGQIEYFSILSYPNLSSITSFNTQVIIALAVKYEKARLIDNIIVNQEGQQVERIDI